MPKKCDSCIYHRFKTVKVDLFKRSLFYCVNERCATEDIKDSFPNRLGVPLDLARDVCDREGDGHFVYFEPRDPSSGAAASVMSVASGASAVSAVSEPPA